MEVIAKKEKLRRNRSLREKRSEERGGEGDENERGGCKGVKRKEERMPRTPV